MENLGPKLQAEHGEGPYSTDQVRAALDDSDPEDSWVVYAYVLFCDQESLRADASLATEAGWEDLVAETRLVVAEIEAGVEGLSQDGSDVSADIAS